MSEQPESDEILDRLKNQLTRYIELKLELLQVHAAEKGSLLVVQLIKLLVVLFLLSLIAFFGCFALAIYLSDVLENYPLGFSLVAIGLLVLLILLRYGIASQLSTSIRNKLIRTLYKHE